MRRVQKKELQGAGVQGRGGEQEGEGEKLTTGREGRKEPELAGSE